MKITEQKLIDGFAHVCVGGDYKSVIAGKQLWWNYRRYDGMWEPTCKPENADYIALIFNRAGKVRVNKTRPDFAVIKKADEEAWGSEI